LAAEHAFGNFEALHPTALGYVNLTLKRMIARGLMAQEQIDEDLIQEANLAALESCRSWVPWQSQLGSWAEVCVRGTVQKYLTGASTGMIGGRDSGYVVLSENLPLEQVELDDPATIADALSYTPVRARAAPHGEEAPEGLGDPMDEAARLQGQERARWLIATLEPDDREMVRAIYGIECAPEEQHVYAARKGLAYRTVKRRLAEVREKLARRA